MDFFINSFPETNCGRGEKDITAIAHAVGGLIEDLTWKVFLKYRKELLAEEITYIVPAVWGAHHHNGSLTPLQEEIHDQISPALLDIFRILEINETADAHSYAVGYITRYMIITKVIYMIEGFRNKFHTHDLNERSKMNLLKELTPYGSA